MGLQCFPLKLSYFHLGISTSSHLDYAGALARSACHTLFPSFATPWLPVVCCCLSRACNPGFGPPPNVQGEDVTTRFIVTRAAASMIAGVLGPRYTAHVNDELAHPSTDTAPIVPPLPTLPVPEREPVTGSTAAPRLAALSSRRRHRAGSQSAVTTTTLVARSPRLQVLSEK